VTADAALETGEANWTFDTWVEFLAEHAGKTEWRIFHPHEYPNMQPEDRATFGLRGVSNRSFNDLIVMANEIWVAGQLDDGTNDVSYTRNQCQAPIQQITASPWIGELCESGYWSPAHWDCMGVRPRSLVAERGFRFTGRELEFGGRIEGTVEITNPTDDRLFGRLVVELVSHRLESKTFVERSYGSIEMAAAVDPGENRTIAFALPLPETLAAQLQLYLRARLDERTIALHEVHVPSRIACEVIVPGVFREGEHADIRAAIRNTSDIGLRNVDVRLMTPFALPVADRASRHLELLRPYESIEVVWSAQAAAPLASGSLHLAVDTSNGGGLMRRIPFRISGLARLERVSTVFQPNVSGQRPSHRSPHGGPSTR
jgi:hypothetical protein